MLTKVWSVRASDDPVTQWARRSECVSANRRSRVIAAVTFLLAVGIAWFGATLLTSRTYQFGNPPFETVIGSCRLASPSVGLFRLYRGNGGATTAIRCMIDRRIALVGTVALICSSWRRAR